MTSQLPTHQKALVQSPTPGILTYTTARPLPPPLLPHQVLVRVAAVALNPCDWKMPTNFPAPGAGVGSDYAGSIVQLGSSIPSLFPDLHEGTRVAGAVHASNSLDPQAGAFAEYITVCADQLWRVPEGMGLGEAAAVGWCVVGTVGLACLHNRHLGLPGSPERPWGSGLEEGKGESAKLPPWVLVYGGSTASGTIAIQFLKLYVHLCPGCWPCSCWGLNFS